MKHCMNLLLWGAHCLLLMLAACSSPSAPAPELGVSWELAQQRAASLSDIRYSLTLQLPDSVSQPIPGSLTIAFQLDNTSNALLLDFREEPDHLQRVVVNQQEVDPVITEGHIVLPAATLRDGANQVEITFIAGDLSLNRNPDYLYTLLVPDRASTAFPCFDQPDLKARYRLVLETPADWEAVGNGPREKVEQVGIDNAILSGKQNRSAPTSLLLPPVNFSPEPKAATAAP
ncbi:MAG: hypothetical protein H6555_00865 [Lewinellaceae bacterium]|nr:hypothetical protein [Lewinellaceae bacterium]